MSYNNYRMSQGTSTRNNYGSKNWNNNNYDNPRSYGPRSYKSNFSQANTGKRRSQVKLITKGNVSYLSGWKMGSKAGFRTFFVSPAKSPVTRVSKSGKTWHSCKVSVENKTHGSTGLFPAWWNPANNMVLCQALSICLNPSTGFISYLPRKK